MKASVILFRKSGKYYTQEEWEVPESALGPHDMVRSPDFRRIDATERIVAAAVAWHDDWFKCRDGTYDRLDAIEDPTQRALAAAIRGEVTP